MFDKVDRNKLLLYANDKYKLIEDVKLKFSFTKKLLITAFMMAFAIVYVIMGGFMFPVSSNALLGVYIIVLTATLVLTLPLVMVLLINKKRKAKKFLRNGEIKVLKVDAAEFHSKVTGLKTKNRYKIFAEVYNFQTNNMERKISIVTNASKKDKQVIGKSGAFAKELVIDEILIRTNKYIVVLEYKNMFHFLPNKLWEKRLNNLINQV